MQKKQKKGTTGFGVWTVIVVVIVGINLLRGMMDGEMDRDVVFGAVPLAVVLMVVGAIAASANKRSNKKAQTRVASATTHSAEQRPGWKRSSETEHAVRRPDPRTKSFTEPDPYCVVCDHTGEDHFARDRAMRIAQLDEWLKNGLIGREEYRTLKEKYEKS